MTYSRHQRREIASEWGDLFYVYPIGDVHVGAAECDESALRATVAEIESTPGAYWIGMGDYIDAIQRTDPRFSAGSLAPWLFNPDSMRDIVGAQRDRFFDIVAPIADRCLTMLSGNHETAVTRHYERDIYGEIVGLVQAAGGAEGLAMGYSGYLDLRFAAFDEGRRKRSSLIRFSLHHGMGGGKLAGGKANGLQRWVWTHDADVTLFGHTHETGVWQFAREVVRGSRIVTRSMLGAYTGSYLSSVSQTEDTYAAAKGYLPLSTGRITLELRPWADRRISVRV